MTGAFEGLVTHVVVALLGVGLLIAASPLMGLRLEVLPWLVIALVGGVGAWLLRRGWDPAPHPTWVEHQAEVGTARPQADLRTSRLADAISSAQPGRAFTTRTLVGALHEVTAQRLVRKHGADPEHPFDDVEGLLSPALLAYLATADDDHSPTVTRATVHRFLKEISEL
ncbi:hypothetical protein [Aestuariimicrobium sp. T2.26MG-19.2B]|uniref:hypothetical protein n=1 Tax=Aestuariimicrobium sp. T2.26MG-19.2B TaxID=3040679 RepID=UPI0024776732|nr:hypothetical protein [Aestuariimicrobium sp. T2.26MG-19.2B]CAI9405020.1 hypothetical protein AESSP_01328 [Aestuariimicrobium sp. T2.26MG-19.2B]